MTQCWSLMGAQRALIVDSIKLITSKFILVKFSWVPGIRTEYATEQSFGNVFIENCSVAYQFLLNNLYTFRKLHQAIRSFGPTFVHIQYENDIRHSRVSIWRIIILPADQHDVILARVFGYLKNTDLCVDFTNFLPVIHSLFVSFGYPNLS